MILWKYGTTDKNVASLSFVRSDEDLVRSLGFQYTWGLLLGRQAEAAECTGWGECEEAYWD